MTEGCVFCDLERPGSDGNRGVQAVQGGEARLAHGGAAGVTGILDDDQFGAGPLLSPETSASSQASQSSSVRAVEVTLASSMPGTWPGYCSP
jgi:hypothetical protein